MTARSGRGPLRRALETTPLSGLGLVWPWLTPWAIASARGTPEPLPTGSIPFRLTAANALGSNRRPATFASTIAAVDTDVLIVVEASTLILEALEIAEVARFHQHGLIETRPRYAGCGVWSRYPLELLEAGDAGHAFIAARVEVAGAPITVVAVHTLAPFRLGGGELWRESFDILAALIDRLERPVVAAGDFNATLGHRPLREFLAYTGLRDAHTAAGRGLARSWPVTRLAPTLGLIDRVAISEELSVTSIEERPMPGSDHRAVIADLLVRPGSPG